MLFFTFPEQCRPLGDHSQTFTTIEDLVKGGSIIQVSKDDSTEKYVNDGGRIHLEGLKVSQARKEGFDISQLSGGLAWNKTNTLPMELNLDLLLNRDIQTCDIILPIFDILFVGNVL